MGKYTAKLKRLPVKPENLVPSKTFKQPQTENDILLGADAITSGGMNNPNDACALPGKVPTGPVGGVGKSANQAYPTRPGDVLPDVAGSRNPDEIQSAPFKSGAPLANTAIGGGKLDHTPPGLPESPNVYGTRVKRETRPDTTLGESAHKYPTRPKKEDIAFQKAKDKYENTEQYATDMENKREAAKVNKKLSQIAAGRKSLENFKQSVLRDNKVGSVDELPPEEHMRYIIGRKSIISRYTNQGVDLKSGVVVHKRADGTTEVFASKKVEGETEFSADIRNPRKDHKLKDPILKKKKEKDTKRLAITGIGRKTGNVRAGYEKSVDSYVPPKRAEGKKQISQKNIEHRERVHKKWYDKISGKATKASRDRKVKESYLRGLKKETPPDSPSARFIKDVQDLDKMGNWVYEDIQRMEKRAFREKYPEGYTKIGPEQQKVKAARLRELRNELPDELRNDLFPVDFAPSVVAQLRPFDELGKMSSADFKAFKKYIKDFEGKSSSVRRGKSGDAYEELIAHETPASDDGNAQGLDELLFKFDNTGYDNIDTPEISATKAFENPEDFGRKAAQDLVYGDEFLFDAELRFAENKDIVKQMFPDIQKFYSTHTGELRIMKKDLKGEIGRYVKAYNNKHRTNINPDNFEHDALEILSSIHKRENKKLEKVNEVFRTFKKDYGVVSKLAEANKLIPTAHTVRKHPFIDDQWVVMDKSGNFLEITGADRAKQYKQIVAINKKRRAGRQTADYEVWAAIQAGVRDE